jgi:hypothetical protein
METDLVCKNRAAAFAALDAMADSMPRGTQRTALLAVKKWMIDTIPPDFDDKVLARLKKIFEGDEADKLGREWYNRGSVEADGKLVPTEADHGARIFCLWNAETKRWEPERIPPRHFEQTDIH